MSVEEFVQLRKARVSFARIDRIYHVKSGTARVYGLKVLPAELLAFQGRRRKYCPEEVLPVEQFIEWRRKGWGFGWIARETGLTRWCVERYAKDVLPEELQHVRAKVRAKPARSTRKRVRCKRCGFFGWLGNPMGKDGQCLWCRVELAGGDLWELHHGDGWAILLAEEARGG